MHVYPLHMIPFQNKRNNTKAIKRNTIWKIVQTVGTLIAINANRFTYQLLYAKGSLSYLACDLILVGTWLNAVKRAYMSNKGPRTYPWQIVSACTLRTHPWDLGRSERIDLLSVWSNLVSTCEVTSCSEIMDLFTVAKGHLDKQQNDWQLKSSQSDFYATRREYSFHKTHKMLQAYLSPPHVFLYDLQYFVIKYFYFCEIKNSSVRELKCLRLFLDNFFFFFVMKSSWEWIKLKRRDLSLCWWYFTK